MSAVIQIRRGTEAELESIKLDVGELGFTTDTHRLFIGSCLGNLFFAEGIPLGIVSKKPKPRVVIKAHKPVININFPSTP